MLHQRAHQAIGDRFPFQPLTAQYQGREAGYALVLYLTHLTEACDSFASWGRPFMSAAFKSHGFGFTTMRSKVH